ncbi:MAG: S1C family serine protease [Planctomycetaceae bacterium]
MTRLMRIVPAIAVLAAGASPGFGQSARTTIRETLPKMVKIFGAGKIRKLHGYGTGFLITPEGHIATVWNHVLDADEVTVILADGHRYQAKLVNAEPTLDLAILKITEKTRPLPYFDLKKAGTAGAGTRILAFSNMFKVATGDEPVSIIHGVIAAKTKLSARRGIFELPYDGAAYIVDGITNNPGSAGGVLMTRDGTLLGMIGREVRNTKTNTWMNYAVPIAELRDTVEDIIAGKFRPSERKRDKENPRRYAALDFDMVMVPDVVYRTPAYIDSCLPGSAAARAGLRPDDLILFVNGELIQSNRMLADELGQLEGGDTLKLGVTRRGVSRVITVTMPVPRKSKAKTP